MITKDCFMLSLVRTFPGITLIRLDWIVVSDRRLHSITQLMTSNEEVFIVLPLISIKFSSFEYSCVYGAFFLSFPSILKTSCVCCEYVFDSIWLSYNIQTLLFHSHKKRHCDSALLSITYCAHNKTRSENKT